VDEKATKSGGSKRIVLGDAGVHLFTRLREAAEAEAGASATPNTGKAVAVVPSNPHRDQHPNHVSQQGSGIVSGQKPANVCFCGHVATKSGGVMPDVRVDRLISSVLGMSPTILHLYGNRVLFRGGEDIMLQKLVLGALAVALPLGLLVTVGAGTAGATPSKGAGAKAAKHHTSVDAILQGIWACDSGRGIMTFNPPLTLYPPYVPTTVTISGTMGRCISTPAAIRASSFVFTGTLPYNNCGQLYSGPAYAPPLVGTQAWDPDFWVYQPFYRWALPFVPSGQVYGTGTYVPVGATGKPSFLWAGVVVSGSYTGDVEAFGLTLRRTVVELARYCSFGNLGSIDFSDDGS